VCAALAGEECAYTTAPVSVPVVPGTPVRPVHGYHAARLDAAGADLAGVLGASAVMGDNGDAPRLPAPAEISDVAGVLGATVVWDNGDASRLPAPAETDGEHDAARDVLYQAKEKLDDLGRHLLSSLAKVLGSREQVAALVADLLDEDDQDQDDDDMEPYCTTCGQWAGIFHGHGGGWHHYRGEGTLTSPVELYDAGHEVTVGWTVPAGRSLSPADITIIRQALADAGSLRSYRFRTARDHREDREADRELATVYSGLADRLAGADLSERKNA
jgi:hypothetical protein